MPEHDWNERYAAAETPWDTGIPDNNLTEFVRSAAVKGTALEVGCGTGTNTLWLAGHGFKMIGVDISQIAIEKARAKAAGANLDCRFEQLDFLNDTVSGGPFDFVFDRGCFHLFDNHEDRARFSERVARVLAPNGRWLSLIGSTEGGERDWGPPRRSVRDVVEAVEPALEIVELRSIAFRDLPVYAAAWLCLSRRREVPAVPSTRRSGGLV
jgi:SAM-dependent methyltransferase